MDKKLNVRLLEEIKFPAWNVFVNDSPQGDVFSYTWWLKAITKDNFKILTVWEDDEIVAGIALAYYLGKIITFQQDAKYIIQVKYNPEFFT